ncbi:MerR family DNA-binding transcriptional regulator [Variovorax sp. J22R133]|uniref:MerR family transcriptional regulator n=1 Tax=Variovorax brevis TaxID=3053503 RepID=UPI0025782B1D|nr:MerR family transcriptional regulator [Variovorax sp. J22R133]MDM0115313.1 MerR family DNA-binding transcriptional regulator [Variovorax sp. J22R133]
MKVSELSLATGVSVHRLRRYEEIGLLKATRKPSGYREFEARAVRDVIFVSMARELGFSLAQLQDWLPRYRAGTLRFDDLREEFDRRIVAVDAEIEALRRLRKKLVDHIAWVQRQKAAARRKAASAPRVPSVFDLSRRRAK